MTLTTTTTNPSDFVEVYENERQFIRRYLKLLIKRLPKHFSTIEDVEQETWTYAWKNWTKFDRNRGELRAWLIYCCLAGRTTTYFKSNQFRFEQGMRMSGVRLDAILKDALAKTAVFEDDTGILEFMFADNSVHSQIVGMLRAGTPESEIRARLNLSPKKYEKYMKEIHGQLFC